MATPSDFEARETDSSAIFQKLLSGIWAPLLLAAVTFLVYWPSLKSDFVYDARLEILDEGFITSPANLPSVLSLKVLGMNLMLGSRPGQLFYLMLIASVCGKAPFGYHLCSNLLHAANVALLFVFLRRLIAMEMPGLATGAVWKALLAAATVSLIFAMHPIAVESVAEVSYSSSLLVTFFTLLALLAATAFRPENFPAALRFGIAGTLCALAAVTSKESGLAAAGALSAYWFLFRRNEAKRPWILFLGAATVVTAAFLVARFHFAPSRQAHFGYLGGAFHEVFLIQPHLWVFMMGKLLWPMQLSADYTPENSSGISMPVALAVLTVVILLQDWLWSRSRIGALGVALYWLGLATVSNFVPLYRALADRFYYLPLAGLAMQLLALLLIILKAHRGFWIALVPLLVAILPLTLLTLTREAVFADSISLWSDTLRVSPTSPIAYYNLGATLHYEGRVDEAIIEYQKALQLLPGYVAAHNNLGVALLEKGRTDEALAHLQTALQLRPDLVNVQNNLGRALLQKGRTDEAIIHFQTALKNDPNMGEAHANLGVALAQKGRLDEAIAQLEEALRLRPDDKVARINLARLEALVRHVPVAK